jgi:hypothetical protein
MEKLLRLKPWPMFTLLFIIPLSLQFVFTYMPFIPADASYFFSRMVNILGLLLYTAWLYAACIRLSRHLPEGMSTSTNRFRIALLFPALYVLSGFITNLSYFTGIGLGWITDNENRMMTFFKILLIVSALGLFYTMYHMARLLKTVEYRHSVRVGDFIGDFFQIWFFPFGIWNIQARLNDIVDRVQDRSDSRDIFREEPVS